MPPKNPVNPRWTGEFRVRARDLDVNGRLAPASLLGLLQEAAENHADRLGVGLRQLLAAGRTWMLARMRVSFLAWPSPGDRVIVTTWPAGARGRTLAYRDFVCVGAEGSPLIMRATSEWLMVKVAGNRIARLPPEIMALASENVVRVDVPFLEMPDADWKGAWQTEIPVRRADMDINRHVNNLHYVEWLFEPLPEDRNRRVPSHLEIVYRLAAEQGDGVVSTAAPLDDDTVAHRLTRASDGALLVEAVTCWR